MQPPEYPYLCCIQFSGVENPKTDRVALSDNLDLFVSGGDVGRRIPTNFKPVNRGFICQSNHTLRLQRHVCIVSLIHFMHQARLESADSFSAHQNLFGNFGNTSALI
jgi:hypothetical protein